MTHLHFCGKLVCMNPDDWTVDLSVETRIKPPHMLESQYMAFLWISASLGMTIVKRLRVEQLSNIIMV